MHFHHGVWQDHSGEPLDITEPDVEQHEGFTTAPADAREEKPKARRSAKRDPRESKGAQ